MSKMSDMSEELRGGIRPRFVEDDSDSTSGGEAEGSEGFDCFLASLAPRLLDKNPPKVGSSHGVHYPKSGWVGGVVRVWFLRYPTGPPLQGR